MHKGFGSMIDRLPRAGHLPRYRSYVEDLAFISFSHVPQKALGKNHVATDIQLDYVKFSLDVIIDEFAIDTLSRIIDQYINGNAPGFYLVINFKSSIVADEVLGDGVDGNAILML